MSTPAAALTPLIQSAMATAFGAERRGTDPLIRPSKFADLQCNAPMALAKPLGMKPREVAEQLVAALKEQGVDEVASDIEISGPGFLNITLSDAWLTRAVTEVANDERLGVPVQERQNIPIDYSAPNAAKEMHVGHIRTTIVGDALARTLEFLGHHVIRQNHIGDWGTPFGMLIEHLLDSGLESEEAGLLMTSPNTFYQHARAKFEGDAADPEFATRARARVAKLQGGDAESMELWHRIMELTKAYFRRIYAKLDVTLSDEDLAGESMYNEWLPGVCAELEERGIAVIDDGALCVFLDGYTGREGKPVPLIIRKSDGGYGYATTDLATIRYRAQDLDADRVAYVIGAPQALHLNMVWDTARKAGWMGHAVPTHVQIGSVLGDDGKMLRTRAGKAATLESLVDEAIDRGRAAMDEMRPDLDAETRERVGWMVGIGAIKYADLAVAHDSEYVFDLERMVSFSGNTGPYLQYAAARMRSILRKAAEASEQPGDIDLREPAEHQLALTLLDLPTAVLAVGDEYAPHKLTAYLYELATAFTAFYEKCPVLKVDDPKVRASRLALVDLTLKVLVTGLDLLGIRAPEEM